MLGGMILLFTSDTCSIPGKLAKSDPLFFSPHLLHLCFEVQGEGVAKNLQVVERVGRLNMRVAAQSRSLNKAMMSSQVEKSISDTYPNLHFFYVPALL